MNELKTANKYIKRFIESGLGLEDGMSRIKSDMKKAFHFSDMDRFSRQAFRDCYKEFENWLNTLMISEPPPDGIAAMYFGMFESSGTFGVYVSGSRRWSLKDPDWACDTFYLPKSRPIEMPLFTDISSVFSEFNHAGLYLAITVLSVLIRQYTKSSIISLLDDKRRTLYVACGFDDGDLYNVGKLTDDGLQAPSRKLFLFQ